MKCVKRLFIFVLRQKTESSPGQHLGCFLNDDDMDEVLYSIFFRFDVLRKFWGLHALIVAYG